MILISDDRHCFYGLILFILILCDVFHHNGSGFGLIKPFQSSNTRFYNRQNTQWRQPPLSEAKLTSRHGNFTLTLTESMDIPTPSYVQILQKGILSVTSFSLLRKGAIMEFDLNGGKFPKEFGGKYLWPNELSVYNDTAGSKVLLIPDGFLTPGQNDGAIYAIRDPNKLSSKPVRITGSKPGWFYHRAIHLTLPDGTEGVLTARAYKSLFTEGEGELVWLTIPKDADSLSVIDASDSNRHLPWEETVLVSGPDVMFEIIDLDDKDDSIEIVAAHFFGRKLSVHSLRGCSGKAPYIELSGTSTIDTVGRPYGLCKANLGGKPYTPDEQGQEDNSCTCDNSSPTHILVTTHECSYDIPSAINMALTAIGGNYPSIKSQASPTFGGLFGIEGTSDEDFRSRIGRLFSPQSDNSMVDFKCFSELNIPGGSLFAYEIPRTAPKTSTIAMQRGMGKGSIENSSSSSSGKEGSTEGRDLGSPPSSFLSSSSNSHFQVSKWMRKTLFRGFKVRGWGGIFSPGAPGFPYVFQMPNRPQDPPMILLAGDCTGSAYIFMPSTSTTRQRKKTQQGRDEEEDGTMQPMQPMQLNLDHVDTIDAVDSPLGDLRKGVIESDLAGPTIDGDRGGETIRIRRAGARDLVGAVQQVAFTPPDPTFNSVSGSVSSSEEVWAGAEEGENAFPMYELAFEIECGATVGSAAVAEANDGSGDAFLYIPSYELNKVHVFRLSQNKAWL